MMKPGERKLENENKKYEEKNIIKRKS